MIKPATRGEPDSRFRAGLWRSRGTEGEQWWQATAASGHMKDLHSPISPRSDVEVR